MKLLFSDKHSKTVKTHEREKQVKNINIQVQIEQEKNCRKYITGKFLVSRTEF